MFDRVVQNAPTRSNIVQTIRYMNESVKPSRVALIAAVAANGVIGRNGTLPWHLPADLQYFKKMTSGSRIVMGRRTWESFPRPLPNRQHVVISSQNLALPEGVLGVSSMHEALTLPDPTPTVFVIGGNQAYTEALQFASDIYLTEIHAEIEGDTHFPTWARNDYQELSRQCCVGDIEAIGQSVPFDFVHYVRKLAIK